jgi:hypothetical protein
MLLQDNPWSKYVVLLFAAVSLVTRMEPKLYSLGRPGSFSTKYDVYLYPVMSVPLFQAIPDKQNAA